MENTDLIILGIDPGSRFTGYGIIRVKGNQSFHLHSGCIKVLQEAMAQRLQLIFQHLQEVILQFQPQEAAIEQVFFHQNPNSALKLGQARGAALAALTMPVTEYSARQIKQSVVGYGAAKKEQVQHMVKRLLNMTEDLQVDQADALAIALCHAHSRLSLPKRDKSTKKNSWRNFRILDPKS